MLSVTSVLLAPRGYVISFWGCIISQNGCVYRRSLIKYTYLQNLKTDDFLTISRLKLVLVVKMYLGEQNGISYQIWVR